nr:MAG TPA: hypothetical protein [Caudoviricetes sp.]
MFTNCLTGKWVQLLSRLFCHHTGRATGLKLSGSASLRTGRSSIYQRTLRLMRHNSRAPEIYVTGLF